MFKLYGVVGRCVPTWQGSKKQSCSYKLTGGVWLVDKATRQSEHTSSRSATPQLDVLPTWLSHTPLRQSCSPGSAACLPFQHLLLLLPSVSQNLAVVDVCHHSRSCCFSQYFQESCHSKRAPASYVQYTYHVYSQVCSIFALAGCFGLTPMQYSHYYLRQTRLQTVFVCYAGAGTGTHAPC